MSSKNRQGMSTSLDEIFVGAIDVGPEPTVVTLAKDVVRQKGVYSGVGVPRWTYRLKIEVLDQIGFCTLVLVGGIYSV